MKKAETSASPTMKLGFQAVDTADGGLQQSISQLKSSGDPASSYTQPVKAGVAALATAFQQLESLSRCA